MLLSSEESMKSTATLDLQVVEQFTIMRGRKMPANTKDTDTHAATSHTFSYISESTKTKKVSSTHSMIK